MKSRLTYLFFLLIALFQFGCSIRQTTEITVEEQKPLVVFLVRHGEKVDHSKDPQLTAAGKERALELAKILRSAEIEFVYSSNFIRTRETAGPTATAFGLETEIYDPQNLDSLLNKLRNRGGHHLVVGHSNTTPQMVKIIGGKPGAQIEEESEYDRLYMISVAKDGSVSSVLMRYGRPFYPSDN